MAGVTAIPMRGAEATQADASGVELEQGYERMLAAAEGRSRECVRAKDDFRRLVDTL